MKSLRFLDRRVGFSVGALGMLFGMMAPAVLPAFASADQITDRSIKMGSTVTGATTDYTFTFTPVTTGAQDVTILFCSDGPITGTTCSAPSGEDLSSATIDASSTDTGGTIDATGATDNTIVIKNIDLGAGDTIILKNVVNTSTLGTFYARIQTYPSTSPGDSDAEAARTGTTPGTYTDNGGVALSTTEGIGVNAYVEESMTFCVAGNNSDTPPDADCSSTLASPSITLGTQEGAQFILSSSTSSATDYAQLSTNAVSGAVVYLKSDAAGCGGLYLATESEKCGILPAAASGDDLADGAGEFGLTVGSSAGETTVGHSTPTGTLTPATGYDATHPYINYVSGDATGVTSPYGSPLFQSGSTPAPVANEYVPITFSANAAATTPAGQYSANLSMIAVGTF